MKKYYCLITALILTAGCGSKGNKTDAANENAKGITSNTPVSQVVGIGKVTPENDIIQLSSEVNGVVEKIYKKENDSVKAGETILTLDHQLEDAKIRQLTNEVATQAAQIKVEEAAVEEYDAKYNNAAAELKRLEGLLARGAETQQTVDDAATNVKAFQSNLNRLKANVTVARNKLAETQAANGVAMVERDQKIIKAPVAGRILEITTLVGSPIDTKQTFAQISPEGRTIAVCEIDELYADKVTEGQRAYIRNLGALDTLSTGTVYITYNFLKKKSLFTDQAGEKEDRRVREVKILLDHPEKLLLNARIECAIDVSGNAKK